MSNKTYDILVYITQIALPALLTFYGVVGATLHIPYVQETLTIGAAFDTLLGTLLKISNNNYKKNIASKGKRK